MRKLVALVALVALLAIPSAVTASGRLLTASMTGAAEVPGPGDPDGSGTAWITVNAGHDEVCWSLQVQGITLPAAAAHIHSAPAGIAGPVVVPLSAPDANGVASGCRTVDSALAKAIQKSPAVFYVNVHTSDFPAGAIRGQLAK